MIQRNWKTFFYHVILAQLRKDENIIIEVATSEIVATLLPEGMTVHSRLHISLRPMATTLCNIRKHSELAELIRRASAVV